jgi:hypothetical protein
MMLAAVAIAGIASAVGARIQRHNEATLRHMVFNAALDARTELGDLARFDVTYQWTGAYRAQVVFRAEDGKQKEGRSYQVDSCACGVKMAVKSSPLP